MKYVCANCKVTAEVSTRAAKCDCGGLWQLDYKPPKFDLALVDRETWGIFRYRAFMPLEGEHWREISLGEGLTPIIPFDEDVLLKMDYCMPTLSFKDRGAAVLIAHCKAIGVDSVVQDSSGNAGNSVAAYCGKAGIDCEIFVPEGTSPKKINMIKAHKARVNVVPGSRDNCANVCRDKVAKEGKYYANHVYNPFFYQGTKTYIYETYEQLHRIPANIVIPLGNGTLVIGIVKALEELLESGVIEKMPQIFAPQ
jgi:threonine synthase